VRHLKTFNRVLSVAIGCCVWSWVHAHDDWGWYNHDYGNADALALLSGLIVGGVCWIVSDAIFKRSGY